MDASIFHTHIIIHFLETDFLLDSVYTVDKSGNTNYTVGYLTSAAVQSALIQNVLRQLDWCSCEIKSAQLKCQQNHDFQQFSSRYSKGKMVLKFR